MSWPVVKDLGIGNSLFKFIEEICFDERDKTGINIAVHRLCSLMRKMRVQSVIIEEDADSSYKVEEERKALLNHYKTEIEINIRQYTFLSKKDSRLKRISSLRNEDFLSQAVIVNFKPPGGHWKSYIYSAIVCSPRVPRIPFLRKSRLLVLILKVFSKWKEWDDLLNNYIHIKKRFPCRFKISENVKHEFEILGVHFSQQNGVTSCCAHASLCMTINNMSERGKELITAEDINKFINQNSKKAGLGSEEDKIQGLSGEQIEAVLKDRGLSIECKDFSLNPDYDYKQFVYRYIESKCPVFLGFSTTDTGRHIVPVLGHTLNTDLWKPEAESFYLPRDFERLEYKSSSEWVDHFIINDDNFGMYLCLPVQSLKQGKNGSGDQTFKVQLGIAVIPDKVSTESWEAEAAGSLALYALLQWLTDNKIEIGEWSDRVFSSTRPIIIRTLLVQREKYLSSLGGKDFEGNTYSPNDKNELTKDLPPIFWLSEISLPDLYTANKSKIMDVFYGAEYPPLKMQTYEELDERWLQIRAPYVLLKQHQDFKDSGIRYSGYPLPVTSHYPLLRLDDGDIPEW